LIKKDILAVYIVTLPTVATKTKILQDSAHVSSQSDSKDFFEVTAASSTCTIAFKILCNYTSAEIKKFIQLKKIWALNSKVA